MRNLIRVDPYGKIFYHGGINFYYSDGFMLSVKIGPSSLPNSEEWLEISIHNKDETVFPGEFQWLPFDVAQIHVEMLPTLLRGMEQDNAEEIILNMVRKA